jgi:hypothetical protein
MIAATAPTNGLPLYTSNDLREVAGAAGLKRGGAAAILAEVGPVVMSWTEIAHEVGVDEQLAGQSARPHRLTLATR